MAPETPIADWIRLIHATYAERPALRLTPMQAQQLWGIDLETCDALLMTFTDLKFLRRTRQGAYARADQR